jgi:hypothetical protein
MTAIDPSVKNLHQALEPKGPFSNRGIEVKPFIACRWLAGVKVTIGVNGMRGPQQAVVSLCRIRAGVRSPGDR